MAKHNIYVFSKNKYIYGILILISIVLFLAFIMHSHFSGFTNLLYKNITQEGAEPKCKEIIGKCPTHWSLSSSKNICVPTKNWNTNSKPNTEKYKNCLTADRRIIETGCDKDHCRLPIPDDTVIPDGWVRNPSNTGIIQCECK